MTLIVKRIRGKPYVYEQYRLGNKVVTKYIGSLEEIVRIYQIFKLRNMVNYRITKRDIKRITKDLVEEVVNFFEKKLEEMVRGVGFEPTQAYATGSSTRPLWPGSGTPASWGFVYLYFAY